MRSFWALFALVAVTSAQYAWRENQSYTYNVLGESSASLAIGERQHTGITLKAQLKIHSKSNDELIAVLRNTEYRPIHGSEEKEAGYKALEMTQENFIIQLKNGVVKGLKVSKTLREWEVTLIRSIVSQLQVDTQWENLVPASINSLPSEENSFGVYKTLEDTVDGNCEVLYEVASIPKFIAQERVPKYSPDKKYLEIVKTKNFDKCKQLPIFHLGLEQSPAASQVGNFMARSSISNIILSGSLHHHNIESSSTFNTIKFSPEIHNKQKVEVLTKVTLTLAHVEPYTENLRPPQNPRTLKSLVVDYDTPITVEQWEQKRQQLYAKSSSSSSSSSSESFEEWHQEISPIHEAQFFPFNPYATALRQSPTANPNKILRKLIEQIAQQLRNPSDLPKENTLDRFTLLTELVRAMSDKQLQQATVEIYSKEHHKISPQSENYIAWMTLRDAVAQAGTAAALKTIRNWIEKGIISGEEAAQIVSTLPNSVIIPSPTYVESFFALVKSPEVTKDNILSPAALFAFSKLVQTAQTDRKGSIGRYPVHVFGPTPPEKGDEVVQKYIFYFDQQLQQAVVSQDSHKIQVAIGALGNIAHPKILRVFEPYLEGKQPISTFQRTLMVVSLKKLSILYPRVARSVLLKIYANKNDAYQVRVAAVYNLMKTNPPASILQRMAEEARYELDINVKSAVKSSIESAARQSEGELQRNAKAAINLLPSDIVSVQHSRNNLKSYILEGLNMGYEQQLQYIGSQDTYIPQGIFHELTKNINGLYRTGYHFESLFSSVSDLYDAIEDNFRDEQSEDFKDESPIDKIEKTLSPSPRWKKPVEGNVQLNLGSMTRLFTFNNKTLLPSIRDIQQVLMILREGQHFNYQKLYQEEEIVLSFPTALGFPSIFTLKTPTLVTVFGQIKLKSPSLEDVMNQADAIFSLSAEGQSVYSTRTQSRISLLIPFEQKQYVAGHDRNIQVHLPLRAKVNIQSQGKVHLEIMPPQEKRTDHRLVHYSTWPYISKQDILDFKPLAEEPSTRYITVRQPIKNNVIVGEKYGLPLRFTLESEHQPIDFKTFYDHMQQHDLISALVFPWAKSSLEKTQFDIWLDTSEMKPITITATYDVNSSDYQNSNSNKDEQSSEMESGKWQRKILKRVQDKLNDSSAFVLDVGMEIKTDEPIKLVSTIAAATSGSRDRYRILGYWSQKHLNAMDGSLDVSLISKNVPFIGKYNPREVDPKMDILVNLKVGESNLSAQGSFERTPERLRYLMQQPLSENITFQSGLMDKYSVSLKYSQVSDQVKDLAYQAYSALRYFGFFYLNEQPVSSAEGSAELQWQYSPDLQFVDLSVKSPIGKSNFQGLAVDKYFRTISVLHPTLNAWERANSPAAPEFPSCSADHSKVNTFDRVSVPMSFRDQWHNLIVCTPDVGSNDRFSVKAIQGKAQSLFVLAKFDKFNNTLVEFRSTSGIRSTKSSVYINHGEITLEKDVKITYPLSGDTVWFTLVSDGETIALECPDETVKIQYKDSTVEITPGSHYRNYIDGVCGTFHDNEYMTSPQNNILRDPRNFAKTWRLSPGQKEINTNDQKDVVFTNVVSDQDAGRADMMGRPVDKDYHDSSSSSSSSESNETKISSKATLHKKLMVIEHQGKHCFSIWPQPSCKTPSRVQKTQTKQAEFVCVEKNETSHSWAKLVARGARPDFSKKGNAQTIEIQVPIACSYV